jgi:hypothetical protein
MIYILWLVIIGLVAGIIALYNLMSVRIDFMRRQCFETKNRCDKYRYLYEELKRKQYDDYKDILVWIESKYSDKEQFKKDWENELKIIK